MFQRTFEVSSALAGFSQAIADGDVEGILEGLYKLGTAGYHLGTAIAKDQPSVPSTGSNDTKQKTFWQDKWQNLELLGKAVMELVEHPTVKATLEHLKEYGRKHIELIKALAEGDMAKLAEILSWLDAEVSKPHPKP